VVHIFEGVPAPGGRVPPHNIEAEESLLGAMMLSREAITAAIEQHVDPADYYKPAHGHIHRVCCDLYSDNEPVDPVTVAEALRRESLLDAIGGRQTLLRIQAQTPASASAAYYASIVHDLSLLRKLIAVGNDISEMGYSASDDVDVTLDQAEALVFQVAEHRGADSLTSIYPVLQETMDRLEQLYDRPDQVTGVTTGYADLDRILLGLQPSNLVIVAARPGTGKTSFALGTALSVAMKDRKPVLFFSMEMDRLDLVRRLLSAEARIDARNLQTGRLSEHEWPKLNQALGRLAEAPFFIDDDPRCTVMEMRAKARRIKSQHGELGLVVVDYLQLMSSHTKRVENRQVEVSEISRGLKILARELQAPVMALAQLNRQLEYRADKRPMLADLRESGCLVAQTRLTRADTNEEVTLGELVASSARDVPVWTLDEHYRLVAGRLTKAFPSGVKETFELQLASGRSVVASANHPFLTIDGWVRVDSLAVGSRIAVARTLPDTPGCATRAAMTDDAIERAAELVGSRGKLAAADVDWLESLGAFDRRSAQARVPTPLLGAARTQIARFLRELWRVGGSLYADRRGAVTIHLATPSPELARDVHDLLVRLDVRSRVRVGRDGPHRTSAVVDVSGRDDQMRFLDVVGLSGERADRVAELRELLTARGANPNVDTIPREVWDHVRTKLLPERGMSARELARRLDLGYSGNALYLQGVSRTRVARLAAALDDEWLHDLATSDVLWDRIVAIEPRGPQPVFDATVECTHNFLANGVVAHNSLEQDADVVMFIYRDDQYNTETESKGIAEIIVGKHRGGPVGTARLAFVERYTMFADMANE
jgi:replicative DNA helicase